MLQTEGPHILDTTVQNLVSRATSGTAFVHPWCQNTVCMEFTFKNAECRESWTKQQSFGHIRGVPDLSLDPNPILIQIFG